MLNTLKSDGEGVVGMKSAYSLVLLLVMVAMAAFSSAQTWMEGTYRLQPEDIIRIQVYNEPQVNALLPIGRDGNISAPFIGIIRAAGKTTSELEQELADEYQRRLRLRDPKVSVTIERYRIIRASVGGFVGRPGNYEVRPGDTLVVLLNQAGGPIPDRADLRRATLRRAGSQELIPIDLYALLIQGDTTQNYVIQDGDELTVPEETRNRILVLGAVAQPGAYPYREPMYLADAITMARDGIRYRSMFSRVLVVREMPGHPGRHVRIQADFVRFMTRGDSTQNIELQPGDIVFIPETRTPDLQQVGTIISTIFYVDRLIRDNIFGFRIR
jgi:polysaccharide biosynthesis/export protein